jgi:hypothetical protein
MANTISWTRLLETGSGDFAKALTTGSDGAIYISGYTQGGLDGQTSNGGLTPLSGRLDHP